MVSFFNTKEALSMERFEYKGKYYIKIKQDWYSEIGEKQPLKIAVELDALFSDSLIAKEDCVKNLLNQAHRFIQNGINQKALDTLKEAHKLTIAQNDMVSLALVLVRLTEVYRVLKQSVVALELLKDSLNQFEELKENPNVQTALATLYCDLDQGDLAITTATFASQCFRNSKKKVSDECMIVWGRIKNEFPELYKKYKENHKIG